MSQIYNSELEKQKEFEFFTDWAYPVDLYRGIKTPTLNSCGEKFATLKSSIKITKCAGREFFESEKIENNSSNFQ